MFVLGLRPLLVYHPSVLLALSYASLLANCTLNVTVDNLDNRIVYHDDWTILKKGSAIDGSVSVTYTAGRYFTLDFEGTAIYIIGSGFEGAAPFLPAVDGEALADFMTGGQASGTMIPIWGTSGLAAGMNHTLNVTIGLNPNVTTKTNFELDAILYTTEDDSTSNPSSSAPPTSSVETISTLSSFPTSTMRSSSTPPHSPINGIIVGVVVGGCLFGLLSIFVARFWLQRAKRRKTRENVEVTPLPFIPRRGIHVTSKTAKTPTGTRAVSSTATFDATILSDRILQEMNEIRVAIARLRDTDNTDHRTAPPEYETVSTLQGVRDNRRRHMISALSPP